MGVTRVGLALGFGIILGIGCSLGAILQFVKLHRERLFTITGLLTLASVAVILAGPLLARRLDYCWNRWEPNNMRWFLPVWPCHLCSRLEETRRTTSGPRRCCQSSRRRSRHPEVYWEPLGSKTRHACVWRQEEIISSVIFF